MKLKLTSLLVAFGLTAVFWMGACAPIPKYAKVAHKTKGQCGLWDVLERRSKRMPRCSAVCPYDKRYTCSLYRDHAACFGHHSHGMDDCYWVWSKKKFTYEGEPK